MWPVRYWRQASTRPAKNSEIPRGHVYEPRGGRCRILVLADVQGQLSSINIWAAKAKATHVICTGNFGFLDRESPSGLTPNGIPPRPALFFFSFSYFSLPSLCVQPRSS